MADPKDSEAEPGGPSGFLPLEGYPTLSPEEMARRAAAFSASMRLRRSLRDFSERPVARSLIEDCLRTAGSAPSGANQQPWHFAVVGDPSIKRQIREAAEAEERAFYGGRAPDEWLKALAPLGTDADKPFLEKAPWLIVIFAKPYGLDAKGQKHKHYYVDESVGIATGFLIAALHQAGLATLTHTPSPMRFLAGILGRPEQERPYLILVVGHPAEGALVPDIQKRSLDEIASFD
jgi:nitroreductase